MKKFRRAAALRLHLNSATTPTPAAKIATLAVDSAPIVALREVVPETLIGAFAIPCSQVDHPAETEVRALRTASNLAIATGDLLAISATLAYDFIVIIGDGTQLSRPAYLKAFAAIFEQPVPVRYERHADSIRISGPLPIAAEYGHWTGTLPDGNVVCTGTYMAMWRRTNSRWQLRSELFVTLT